MADRLISCDDHMDLSQLPADLWTSRLPASLLDRAPHVEERDGQAVWVCDGKAWGRWEMQSPGSRKRNSLSTSDISTCCCIRGRIPMLSRGCKRRKREASWI